MDLSTLPCAAVRGVLFGGTLEAAASKLLEFRKSDGRNELERAQDFSSKQLAAKCEPPDQEITVVFIGGIPRNEIKYLAWSDHGKAWAATSTTLR